MNFLEYMNWLGDFKIYLEVMEELGIEFIIDWDINVFKYEVECMILEEKVVWYVVYGKMNEDFKECYFKMSEKEKMQWCY